MNHLQGKKVLVLGASRGLGRGIAEVLAARGAEVTGVGRSADAVSQLGDVGVHGVAGDATDPDQLARWLEELAPDAAILTAGVSPRLAALSDYTWEALSAPWETDVKATFHLLQAALAGGLSHVVVFSSGAALNAGGSPLSGGYAGAKQTQRFLCRYAAGEAHGRELDLRISCIVPQLNPNTQLGAAAVKAYAAKAGIDEATFVAKRFGDRPLSPAIAGAAIADLVAGAHAGVPELMLSGAGLSPIG
jgi:NAD(P)-dependent dehydrogenase (short-subunit alcohol dehydrogenase family)